VAEPLNFDAPPAHPGGGALLVSAADVESWIKAGVAAVAFGAALWAPVTRWRVRRRARHEADIELREAMLECARKTADVARFELIQKYGGPGDPGHLPDVWQRTRRAAVMLDDLKHARARLWRALGMPDPEADDAAQLTSEEKRVLMGLTQTMRLQARNLSPEERTAFIAEKREREFVLIPPVCKPGDNHE